MRYDASDHTVDLEDGRDVCRERRGGGTLSHAGTYAGDLDVVCPCDEKRCVVLPVEATFKEICSRTVFGTVDEGDA